MARAFCRRCLRPAVACHCPHLVAVESRTRVVFLQHPRERRVPVSTCRMAHLSLPNSELRVGLQFDGDPHVEALAGRPGTAVLFPGDGATDISRLEPPPETLIVIDGTWVQARKVLERNAVLRRLPRVGLRPERPGNYRIRREPAAHCLSTIEAVVEVLGELEGEPARFQPILRAFDAMVEAQLAHAASGSPQRRKRRRQRERRPPVSKELVSRWPDLVAVYAEANAHAAGSAASGPAELVQLVATRLASGARFEVFIAPRRQLAEGTPFHLAVPASRLLAGEDIGSAMARWASFVRPADLLCTWGSYPLDLLRAEGAPEREALDVRLAVARRLSRRTGGVEQAASLLAGGMSASSSQAGPRPPAARAAPPNDTRAAGRDVLWAAGRAGRRIAALEDVLRALAAEAAAQPTAGQAAPVSTPWNARQKRLA
ncbi:MAG: DTW domain-containing protein [Myxococcales bacterium]|nr:DTW domain-containing protein [Myxococcales bacterium]